MIDQLDDDLQLAIQQSILCYNQQQEQEKEWDTIIKQISRNQFEFTLQQEAVSYNDTLFKEAYNKLNDFQKNIILDCIEKKSAGLSLPLGSGKTLISLILALYFTKENIKPILVVASKTLISNWVNEIKKFFGEDLVYEIVHRTNLKDDVDIWKIQSNTQLILTTIDVLAKYYKEHNVDKLFVKQRYLPNKNMYTNEYVKPDKPFLNHILGGGYFYSIDWGCLIVDEVQKYTNISTLWCQSLGAICSKHRWLLSGTIFDEPKTGRILGYHIILNADEAPRDLPKMEKLIHDKKKFKGLNQTLVSRDENKAFIPPKVKEHLISHNLNQEEEKVYLAMRLILNEIKTKAEKAKLLEDDDAVRRFNSYKLVMIMYLRQALICPFIPLTSIVIDACDLKNRSELSKIILKEVNKLGLTKWLNNTESVKSSRIKETLKNIDKHKEEKIIIFACFKSYLDVLQHFLKDVDRPIFRMSLTMSSKKRGELIQAFEKSHNGILLLTYQLGAEGLNLQFASTVFITDFWWNASKIQQAVGRIFRYGQVADEINVYFFTANTGIEKILFEKQKAKLDILKELRTGVIETKIPMIKMDDIVKMILLDDNTKLLKKVKYY